MKSIFVKSALHSYRVVVGKDLLPKAGKLMRSLGLSGKVCIVTQRRVPSGYLSKVRSGLHRAGYKVHVHYVPNGESAKSQKELFRVYRTLLKAGFERGDTLLALGGGVVGDLTGFAASSYLRGLSYVNIATTLLAQVDSAIGGKTGINLTEGKNLVGAFYPPRLVVSDVRTLRSLPAKELKASLAEVIKYGVIRDRELFKLLERSKNKVLNKDLGVLERIVLASSKIKIDVVMRDEHEKSGLRAILNYGHTFGHGFEKVARYRKLVHGEAVGIGMICAADLAEKLKLVSPEFASRQRLLIRDLGLPVSLSRFRLRSGQVLKAMMHDKKKVSGKLQFVLPKGVGKVTVKGGIPLGLVRQVLVRAGARK